MRACEKHMWPTAVKTLYQGGSLALGRLCNILTVESANRSRAPRNLIGRMQDIFARVMQDS